ncbi:type I-G CRISPR-associated RAMP protein Csb1/Cas7g [Methanoplanus endosymbiosus]|uniref:Type I-U CRISPR-associated RAMP protein Csb1/Cas7u n=1 Tax=Methanoplanus endosymbiosus TaxID=33865 RepID=A0A9E7TKU9_9EURY|nr:type I-U CRISPR-associated RAMP protein Csb1/Cas7u [Methanoplanus endosymbiosus]UUX93119.1 type I-U CRISPR-associated RAMP protein Csb1/Cas7u [Methanoplanus endosymbiosus]
MTKVTIDSEKFKNVPRILIEADLKVIQGDRFQPTGFPDLGAAVYEKPDGKRMILVESAQSIANRLEATILDESGIEIAEEFEGLPYIRAKLSGEVDDDKYSASTTSLIEAHRINSPFIISNDEFKEEFKKKAEYDKGKPLNWKKIASALLYYDSNSLLHGAFMANLEDGRVKVQRALTGFIEAEGINEVSSGGVKNNPLDPTGKIRADNYDKDVYGNVPYHRMEYTAERITAYFNFDISLFEGYGLPKEAKELLIALGLYKIRKLLNNGLRLRTSCDFVVKDDVKVVSSGDFVIPSESELLKIVMDRIQVCKSSGLFADPAVTELSTEVIKKVNDSDKKSESS